MSSRDCIGLGVDGEEGGRGGGRWGGGRVGLVEVGGCVIRCMGGEGGGAGWESGDAGRQLNVHTAK